MAEDRLQHFDGYCVGTGMTQLTMHLAATHDHWTSEAPVFHAGTSLRLWWRHLSRHYPLVVDVIEWLAAATIASALLVAQLVANA